MVTLKYKISLKYKVGSLSPVEPVFVIQKSLTFTSIINKDKRPGTQRCLGLSVRRDILGARKADVQGSPCSRMCLRTRHVWLRDQIEWDRRAAFSLLVPIEGGEEMVLSLIESLVLKM